MRNSIILAISLLLIIVMEFAGKSLSTHSFHTSITIWNVWRDWRRTNPANHRGDRLDGVSRLKRLDNLNKEKPITYEKKAVSGENRFFSSVEQSPFSIRSSVTDGSSGSKMDSLDRVHSVSTKSSTVGHAKTANPPYGVIRRDISPSTVQSRRNSISYNTPPPTQLQRKPVSSISPKSSPQTSSTVQSRRNPVSSTSPKSSPQTSSTVQSRRNPVSSTSPNSSPQTSSTVRPRRNPISYISSLQTPNGLRPIQQSPFSTRSNASITPYRRSSRSMLRKQIEENRARKLVIAYSRYPTCLHCYLFENGNIHAFSLRSVDVVFPTHKKMDVTLISILSDDRIPFLPHLVSRWKGPVVLSLWTTQEMISSTTKRLQAFDLPSSLRILFVIKKRGSISFPINRLRNLAICLVRTSHYLVLDMDMFPTTNLYSELLSLPTSLTSSRDNVFIVPAIFLNRPMILQSCDNLMKCVAESLKYMPSSKPDIYSCFYNDTCLIRKGKKTNRNHLLLSTEWVNDTHPQTAYTKVKCFPNRFQEPYVMIKREEGEVMFNPVFINYGCNKVQMIEHLRSTNHSFYLLNNAFATDIAHHDSYYRLKYIQGTSGETAMGRLCYSFLDGLNIVYGTNTKTPLCTN